MIEIIVIVVISVMLRMLLPVSLVIVPVVSPRGCAKEQRREDGVKQGFPVLHDRASFLRFSISA
jgi:hypothetical protein